MGRGWSFLLGIAFLLGAAYFAQRSLEFRRHGEVVSGTVVAVDARLSSDEDGLRYSKRALVQYTPASGGEALSMRTSWSSAWFGSLQPGDSVRVRYLPRAPQEAREDSLLFDCLGPLALLLLAVGSFTGKLRSTRGETVWWRRGVD